MTAAGRWPPQVFGEGDEPDPRFSFANERAFLAWLRTSLALIAGGVALDSLAAGLPEWARKPVAVLLIALGVACSCYAYRRWMTNERALRRAEPLPGFRMGRVVSVGLVVGALAVLVLVAVRR